MKYVKLILCCLLICVMLSGCSFKISSSIDDLISPLSPFGENADIKDALDRYEHNGYSLKTPVSGNYITSYNFYDLDSDKTDEAVAFYEPSDNLGTINMAVIKKVEDDWKVVENIQGDGRDVHSLDFCDLNGDGRVELIVCWNAISNSSNHELSVYRIDDANDKPELKKIQDTVTINNYTCVNITGDKVKELLLFKINSGSSSSAKAELYSLKNNRFRLLGETKLDSHITSYVSIKTENSSSGKRIYADALGSDGSSMLTEVLLWSDNYKTIISPFYSYRTGLTKDTSRRSIVNCTDIDGDGVIDIPTDYKIRKLPVGVGVIDWCEYKKSTLIHSNYSLFAKNDGYVVTLPDNVIDSITVKYDAENRKMTVINRENKKEVFSIIPVLKATYSPDKYKGYQNVLEESGYYYLAKIGNDESLNIKKSDLSKYIKSI